MFSKSLDRSNLGLQTLLMKWSHFSLTLELAFSIIGLIKIKSPNRTMLAVHIDRFCCQPCRVYYFSFQQAVSKRSLFYSLFIVLHLVLPMTKSGYQRYHCIAKMFNFYQQISEMSTELINEPSDHFQKKAWCMINHHKIGLMAVCVQIYTSHLFVNSLKNS